MFVTSLKEQSKSSGYIFWGNFSTVLGSLLPQISIIISGIILIINILFKLSPKNTVIALHYACRSGFPGGSAIKNLPATLESQKCGFEPWVGKIPWKRAWLPTPVFLPGEFHGQRTLVGCSSWSHKESDTTEQLT